MVSYSKRDIAERIGETTRKISWWIDQELVLPDIESSRGKGVPLVFSERNLIEFRMIQVMKDECGLSLASIKNILTQLRMISDPDQRKNSSLELAHDFYSNPEWGEDLEILYVYKHQDPAQGMLYEAAKSRSERGQDILRIKEPKPLPEPIDDKNHLRLVYPPSFEALLVESMAVTVIGIGKIKNQAMEMLGIN